MIETYGRLPATTGLRLHLNENTAGCSPAVLTALQAVTRQQIAWYPDYDGAVGTCAARFGVQREELLLTNGLDEGILAATVAALRGRAPGEAITIVPAFDMYAICANAAGARTVPVPSGDDFAFPLDDVLAAVRPETRIVFLTNPNNPTGQLIPRQAILAIADAAPGATVFVDEAYVDFATRVGSGSDPQPEPSAPLDSVRIRGLTPNQWSLIARPELASRPNVIVGRTFSKAYGLAGLRMGALIGHPDTLEPLKGVVPPYSLNIFATVAVCAALADLDYYQWYLEQVEASRGLLYAAFRRLGVRHWPSAANFVLADFGPDVKRIVDALAARQINVRNRSSEPGCRGCARITAGIVEHTQAFVTALEEIL